MAGRLHQGTLRLFADDPWLAFDLLGLPRPTTGTPVDRRAEVERDHPRRPGQVESSYPDLVLVYEDPDQPGTGVVMGVEAQGKLDPNKRWQLLWYQAALAKDYRLPTWMIVISFCPRMSAALRRWKSGPPPPVHVLLLDATTVAPVLDLSRAIERPAASVLGAILHACRGDTGPARVALEACMTLEKRRRDDYIGTILAAVPSSRHDTLTQGLQMQERDSLWHIEERSCAYQHGLQAGLEDGKQAGMQAGMQAGRRATLVELVLTVLEVRGVSLSADELERVRGCDDMATLERWAQLAREVEHGAALFDEG